MAEVWHLTTAWVPFPNELNYLEAVLEIQIIQNNFVKTPHAAETYINIKGVSKARGRGLLSWDIYVFFSFFQPTYKVDETNQYLGWKKEKNT